MESKLQSADPETGNYPGLGGGSYMSAAFLTMEEEGRTASVRVTRWDRDATSHCPLHRCNGTTSQEAWVGPGRWERQGHGLPPEPKEPPATARSRCEAPADS